MAIEEDRRLCIDHTAGEEESRSAARGKGIAMWVVESGLAIVLRVTANKTKVPRLGGFHWPEIDRSAVDERELVNSIADFRGKCDKWYGLSRWGEKGGSGWW